MKLTAREKKMTIVGACIAIGVLLYYAATIVLPNTEELTRQVKSKERALLEQKESLNGETRYKTRLEELRGHVKTFKTRLLPGDNPNIAGAELQKILKGFADQSGVEITMKSTLPVPDKKVEDMLTKISVKIDTNCNLEQLVQFIYAIENYETYLKIDECTISGFRIQRRFEIRPSLTISGYISALEVKS